MELPDPITALVDDLWQMPGVTAVVLGGSRATGSHDAASDWDLGVYYRGAVALAVLERYGEVHPPGSWGRLMNGGAWLDLPGHRVDVLLRDLDVVERWTTEAGTGGFELDGVLGYVAGLPTYSLTAEVAGAVVLRGSLDIDGQFPEPLRETAGTRWRFHRDFSLRYAAMHARRGNAAGVLGQVSRAVFEEGHARRCDAGRWALNEKRLLDGCGLEEATSLLDPQSGRGTASGGSLGQLVADLADVLCADDSPEPPARNSRERSSGATHSDHDVTRPQPG